MTQTFVVELYELYSQKYLVEAVSKADAISSVLDGDGRQWGEPDFLETAEQYGMPVEESQEDNVDSGDDDGFEEYVDRRTDSSGGIVEGVRSVSVADEDDD
jgi:hypothetical protein